MADKKRQIIRAVGVLGLALAAGHYVQSKAERRAVPVEAAEALDVKVGKVTTVAATEPAPVSDPAQTAAKPAPEIRLPAPSQLDRNPPAITVAPVAAPQAPEPAPVQAATAPAAAPAPAPAPAAPAPAVAAAEPAPAAPANECNAKIELLADDMGMIGVTIIAPCAAGQSMTLRHSGLVMKDKLGQSGAYFAFVPALEREANVTVTLEDGTDLTASVEVEAMDSLRRLALVWQAPDQFGLQIMEQGEAYGAETTISAANPQLPAPGETPKTGYLTRLGAEGDKALMAEVYTYPATPGAEEPQIAVEAALSEGSCGGHELFGQIIRSEGGKVATEELTLATPECDGLGGFLVLNIPAGQSNIAALN